MEPQGAADLCRRIAEDAAAQAAELLRLAAEKASARIAQAEAEAARLREEAVLRGRAAAAQEETRLLAKVRLEYNEFFGKFFAGDGAAYEPISIAET